MGIRNVSFFMCRKILCCWHTVPFRINMIKEQPCIIDVYLSRLMRVVVTRLKMEIKCVTVIYFHLLPTSTSHLTEWQL